MRRPISEKNRRFAKTMRRDPTEAEFAMWQIVRGKRLEGLRFRRQHPIENYIVDFICLDEKLIVEIDGSQHADNAYDRERDARLIALGFTVLRFWNEEVLDAGEFSGGENFVGYREEKSPLLKFLRLSCANSLKLHSPPQGGRRRCAVISAFCYTGQNHMNTPEHHLY